MAKSAAFAFLLPESGERKEEVDSISEGEGKIAFVVFNFVGVSERAALF